MKLSDCVSAVNGTFPQEIAVTLLRYLGQNIKIESEVSA